MKHPIDALVSLEDGTLSDDERAVLDAHLTGCATCRAEVEFAAAARGALRRLPAPAVPESLLDPVRDEAHRIARDRSPEVTSLSERDGRAARWQRITAGLGVAAAIALVAALALPRLGGDDPLRETLPAAGGESSGALEMSPASEVEIQDQDYDLAGVQAIATAFRTDGGGAATSESAPAATGAITTDASVMRTAAKASECLRTAFERLPGEPVRLIQARYLSTPAIFGVFLESPGAGEPANRAIVLVAATEDCSVLARSRATLDGE